MQLGRLTSGTLHENGCPYLYWVFALIQRPAQVKGTFAGLRSWCAAAGRCAMAGPMSRYYEVRYVYRCNLYPERAVTLAEAPVDRLSRLSCYM